MSETKAATHYCSFCGKSQHEVWRIVAAPRTAICDECVDACTDVLAEGYQKDASSKRLTASEATSIAAALYECGIAPADPVKAAQRLAANLLAKGWRRSAPKLTKPPVP